MQFCSRALVALPPFPVFGGLHCEQSIFRVANESGQVLLLLSLIAIGREIGKEIQVRRDKDSFGTRYREAERVEENLGGRQRVSTTKSRFEIARFFQDMVPPSAF